MDERNNYGSCDAKEPCITQGYTGNDGPIGCAGTQVASPGKIQPIVIKQLSYGYMVNVGCKSFAIEQADKLIEYLTEYINRPDETEKNWYSGILFKTKDETN